METEVQLASSYEKSAVIVRDCGVEAEMQLTREFAGLFV